MKRKYKFNLFGLYTYPISRMIFYTIESHLLRETNDNINWIKDWEDIDMRCPAMLVLESGGGKNVFMNQVIEIMKDLDIGVRTPSSFHPEALLGKLVENEESGIFEETYGILRSDFVIFDEAYEIVYSTTAEKKLARQYIRTALNPYGHNKLQKDITAADTWLEFHPFCTLIFLLQPVKISYDVVKKGLLRRCLIYYSEDIPPKLWLVKPKGMGHNIIIETDPKFDTLSTKSLLKIEKRLEKYLLKYDEDQVLKHARHDIGANTIRMAICIKSLGYTERVSVEWALFDAQIFYNSLADYMDKYAQRIVLPKRYKQLLVLLAKLYHYALPPKEKITRKKMAEIMGCDIRSIYRYIKDLKKRGIKI